jgi:hypothetical protein
MSWQAHKAVIRHSRSKGATRCVLHCLAEHAHDDGSEAFPNWDTIQREANVARGTIRPALERLIGLGEIEATGARRSGTRTWRVVLVDLLSSSIPEPGDSSIPEPPVVRGSDPSSSRIDANGSGAVPEPSDPSGKSSKNLQHGQPPPDFFESKEDKITAELEAREALGDLWAERILQGEAEAERFGL